MAKISLTGVYFENCSINYDDNEDVLADKFITIMADCGYEFLAEYEDGIHLTFGNRQYEPTNYGDKLVWEYDLSAVSGRRIFVSGEYGGYDNPISATLKSVNTNILTISATLENCSINYEDGEQLNSAKPIIITPDDGFLFKGKYDNSLKDDEGNYYILINERNRLIYNILDDDVGLELVGDIIAVEDVVVSLSSFTDIFKISDSELTDLSKRRWLDTDLMPIDLGSYINNLYVFPIHLEDGLIGTMREIYLGKYKTNVNSYIINSYEYVIDLGTIEVPEIYHNVYDYINTKCILYLPFFDKIYLNNEYVIGQSLYIEYVVNLYTGYVTMNIISSFTGEIIDSKNSLISANIPFMHGANVMGGFNNNSKNVISKAYVEIVRNIPYNVNTPFGKNVIEYGKLIDYNGYIECDNIQLNSSATNREKSDIVSLLGKGVYINENK